MADSIEDTTQLLDEASLTHAWRYFELHANQRMSLFNFFLVLSGLVSAGLAASFESTGSAQLISACLGGLLTLVSFTFWKLDQRVSFLLKHAEAALKELEKEATPKAVLFLEEPDKTHMSQTTGPLWKRHWTYGTSFRIVFFVMGSFGLASVILSSVRCFG